MDGITPPDLWDLVRDVFLSSQNQLSKTKGLSVPKTIRSELVTKQRHCFSIFKF